MLQFVHRTNKYSTMQQLLSPAQRRAALAFAEAIVVVGTGAGGAVVGRELAEKGYAVVFLEEGPFLQRHEFCRSVLSSNQQYYRNQIMTVGNTVIPVLVGKLVGGSTAVNTGTCLRPPDRILNKWCETLGSEDFSPENMHLYFERVNQQLQVAPSDRKAIGPFADIIARGCDKLGFSHYAIPRNAPDCKGEGFCIFGCAADARRSTNVSYIPPALQRGAMVMTSAQVNHIAIEKDRAVGQPFGLLGNSGGGSRRGRTDLGKNPRSYSNDLSTYRTRS